VVIVMIGVLAAVAVVFIRPRSFAATARGYADEVAALADSVRQRAVASRTFQRLEVQADRVIHSQAPAKGMMTQAELDDAAANNAFQPIGLLPVPSEVVISAVDFLAHDEPANGVPVPGTGIPFNIYFSPDGSAVAASIFIEDVKSENRARVVIYSATGSAYAYYEW